jgi:hypothetical protein
MMGTMGKHAGPKTLLSAPCGALSWYFSGADDEIRTRDPHLGNVHITVQQIHNPWSGAMRTSELSAWSTRIRRERRPLYHHFMGTCRRKKTLRRLRRSRPHSGQPHRLARGEIRSDDYRQHLDALNHRPNE